VVRDTIVVDSLFVRPSFCHYYFGAYYGSTYVSLGFTSCYTYSRSRYDSIIVYERYRYRDVPNWEQTQINITIARNEGRAPVPPRSLFQQNIVQNVTNVTNVTNNVTNVTNQNTTNVHNVKNIQ